MTDRRYTHDPCECGNLDCAGCEDDTDALPRGDGWCYGCRNGGTCEGGDCLNNAVPSGARAE